MLKAELKNILKRCNLPEQQLEKQFAEELFPEHKHPELAFRRMMKGHGVLDAEQLSKLATLLGCTIQELFSGGSWKAKASHNKIHIFTSGDFTAELDTVKFISSVYKNNSLIHEEVIHKTSISLSEYLTDLDKIINKKQ
jgi:hypothetical protein